MASLSSQVSARCDGVYSLVELTTLAGAPGSSTNVNYTWTVINQDTGIDYGGPVEQGGSAAVPNGPYQVRIRAIYDDDIFSTAYSILHNLVVSCTPQIYLTDIVLNWQPASPAPAMGYEVQYRSKNGGGSWLIDTTSSTSYRVSVPVSSAPYEARVRSICALGSYSDFISTN